MSYTLKVYRKNGETLVSETSNESYHQAERRLGELWNQYAAYDSNNRFRATMTDNATRRVIQTIS